MITLVNPTDAAVSVAVATVGGETADYVVPAGSAISSAVTAGATLRVSGATGLRASLSYAEAGELASGVLVGSRPLADPITVYP